SFRFHSFLSLFLSRCSAHFFPMETRAQDLSIIPEHKRVLFVHPTGKFDKAPVAEESIQVSGSLTGAEARSFYEELLAEDASTSEDVKPSLKLRERKRRVPIGELMIKEELCERDHHKFLTECTSGELKNVMKWFERGVNLSFTDQFGWTALHCAAAAGRTDIVLFLIENGANWSLVESTGKSFADLANRKTMNAVTKWFERQSELDDEEMEEPRGHCSQCGRTYSGSVADHLTNLSHIVRMNKQNPSFSGFVIPEWNPGFKLLRKAGWTEDKGLGKERQGQKYPVRTVLKRDRAGLGSSGKGTARVTHFEANDERAVERVRIQCGETKKEREKRLNKEKRMERNLRWAFNDPS
ncbi:hypothetical protein PMAYCL1PPCAC_06357, partial [Pristionchus mayeri]